MPRILIPFTFKFFVYTWIPHWHRVWIRNRCVSWHEDFFFLTSNLKERAVNLAYRDENGALHFWDNQLEIIEQHVLTEALASPP